MRLVMGALVVAICGLVTRTASACSPSPCRYGELLPGDGATVPASLTAFEWLGAGGHSTTMSVVRLDGGVEVPVATTFADNVVTLGEPLVAGADYLLRGTLVCSEGDAPYTQTSHITVAPAAALPTELGTVTAADIGIGPVTAITYIGSCNLEVDASRSRVLLAMHASAEAWSDAMVFETWVDGARWRPVGSLGGPIGPLSGSWIGRGEDVAYAHCVETDLVVDEGLGEGPHTVEMRARIAGTTDWVASDTTSIALSCSGYVAPDGGGVGYGGIDAGVRADAGAGEAGAPGGGCRAAPGRAGWVWIAVAAGVMLRRRW